jgi:alpha-N-arabinofuranosidase
MHASVYGRGTVLNTIVKAPSYDSKHGDAPYLDSVVIADDEHDTLTIFAVNKNLEEDIEMTCDLRQYQGYKVAEHIVLTHEDLMAENTEKTPDKVKPVTMKNSKIEKGILTSILPAKSWNVIRLTK